MTTRAPLVIPLDLLRGAALRPDRWRNVYFVSQGVYAGKRISNPLQASSCRQRGPASRSHHCPFMALAHANHDIQGRMHCGAHTPSHAPALLHAPMQGLSTASIVRDMGLEQVAHTFQRSYISVRSFERATGVCCAHAWTHVWGHPCTSRACIPRAVLVCAAGCLLLLGYAMLVRTLNCCPCHSHAQACRARCPPSSCLCQTAPRHC